MACLPNETRRSEEARLAATSILTANHRVSSLFRSHTGPKSVSGLELHGDQGHHKVKNSWLIASAQASTATKSKLPQQKQSQNGKAQHRLSISTSAHDAVAASQRSSSVIRHASCSSSASTESNDQEEDNGLLRRSTTNSCSTRSSSTTNDEAVNKRSTGSQNSLSIGRSSNDMPLTGKYSFDKFSIDKPTHSVPECWSHESMRLTKTACTPSPHGESYEGPSSAALFPCDTSLFERDLHNFLRSSEGDGLSLDSTSSSRGTMRGAECTDTAIISPFYQLLVEDRRKSHGGLGPNNDGRFPPRATTRSSDNLDEFYECTTSGTPETSDQESTTSNREEQDGKEAGCADSDWHVLSSLQVSRMHVLEEEQEIVQAKAQSEKTELLGVVSEDRCKTVATLLQQRGGWSLDTAARRRASLLTKPSFVSPDFWRTDDRSATGNSRTESQPSEEVSVSVSDDSSIGDVSPRSRTESQPSVEASASLSEDSSTEDIYTGDTTTKDVDRAAWHKLGEPEVYRLLNAQEEEMTAGKSLGVAFQAMDLAGVRTSLGGNEDIDMRTPQHSRCERRNSRKKEDEVSLSEELFFRLNHARQTFEFVARMKHKHLVARPLKVKMSVFDALHRLGDLQDHEHMLRTHAQDSYTVLEHSLLTAENIRIAYPKDEWFQVTGLIHSLGQLLRHTVLGDEPKWAVCGETFPVGCRFTSAIQHSEYFMANPDRRKRRYSTLHGIYAQNCGLHNVRMSWTAYEYLYHVLHKNKVKLPKEAHFAIRYQKFESLGKDGAYCCLMSRDDVHMMPWIKRLRHFREIAYSERRDVPKLQQLYQRYGPLCAKFFPDELIF